MRISGSVLILILCRHLEVFNSEEIVELAGRAHSCCSEVSFLGEESSFITVIGDMEINRVVLTRARFAWNPFEFSWIPALTNPADILELVPVVLISLDAVWLQADT